MIHIALQVASWLKLVRISEFGFNKGWCLFIFFADDCTLPLLYFLSN